MTMYSPRSTFDRHLQRLTDEVLVLGSLVEQAVLKSVEALSRQDRVSARSLYQQDQYINERRYAIENECIILLATQQPMGRDVRYIAGILEIITELERIGDYAKGISKITLLMDEADEPQAIQVLQRMANIGLVMLRRALTAFTSSDVAAARAIPQEDDAVDRLYNQLHDRMIEVMLQDRTRVSTANYLMWAAHNLERMADRVINICERVVYVVTGEMKELDTPNGLEELKR